MFIYFFVNKVTQKKLIIKRKKKNVVKLYLNSKPLSDTFNDQNCKTFDESSTKTSLTVKVILI